MFGALTNTKRSETVTDEEVQHLESMCRAVSDEIEEQARQKSVSQVGLNGSAPSDVVAVIDSQNVVIAFQKVQSQSTTVVYHADRSRVFSGGEVIDIAQYHIGHSQMSVLTIPAHLLGQPSETIREFIRNTTAQYVDEFERRRKRPTAPSGYGHMQPALDLFSDDYPAYERNVFVAMRFTETAQHAAIWTAISNTLAEYGMRAHRADTKVYPQDDDLWTNVCCYMLGCKFGICVFEQIDSRDFNPNVQIEYGFMRALDKRVLLLKDSRQPDMPTDIVGKVYKPFDSYQIADSVSGRVRSWVEQDLGLPKIATTGT